MTETVCQNHSYIGGPTYVQENDTLNKGAIKEELKGLVRGSVEETLYDLLEKEAQELTQAARYERTETPAGPGKQIKDGS